MMVKLARGLVATLAVVAVAGCATPPGGTAFEVNGQTVSNRQVDRSASDCATLSGVGNKSAIRSDVASILLRGLIARQVAADNDITITDAARTAAETKYQSSKLMNGGQCQVAGEANLDLLVVLENMGEAKFVAAARKLTVVVNPQYGTYDPTSVGLSGRSGSLSNDGSGPISLGG